MKDSLLMNQKFKILSIFLIAFGFLTIKEGGSVLFFDSTARTEAGNYVPFVLWFNFLAGFAYAIAGFGVYQNRKWSVPLSTVIATLTAIVFIALFIHISMGGLYEKRTLIAMSMRTSVWVLTSFFLLHQKKKGVFNGR